MVWPGAVGVFRSSWAQLWRGRTRTGFLAPARIVVGQLGAIGPNRTGRTQFTLPFRRDRPGRMTAGQGGRFKIMM